MSATNWLDDLEAQLEARLDRFLQSNPQQQTLLEEQHRRERQTRLLEQRLTLQQQAQQQRQGLLRMAGEIRQWQERVERARSAGASDLAVRAESHIASLMEQGRQRWQNLGELGQRFQAVEQELNQLTGASGPASPPSPDLDLDTAWSRFEAQQELEELRRRQRN
jgi:hercynine metabolism protein